MSDKRDIQFWKRDCWIVLIDTVGFPKFETVDSEEFIQMVNKIITQQLCDVATQ
jgi:hypothetical protein